MKKHVLVKVTAVVAAALFLGVTIMEVNAHARAGGGRSSGSRASRSYSGPASNYSQPGQSRQQAAPAPTPFQQQQQPRGGFLRSMAGGLMGGMLGGMLFSSLGFAGGGGFGGGGIGLFQILLLAGIGYLIYRFVKNRRSESAAAPAGSGYQGGTVIPASYRCDQDEPAGGEVERGLLHLRQMDPSFQESRFNDGVMDIFFKVQGAWMHRDLSPVSAHLTEEMKRLLQEDVDGLLRDRRVNRLENIAVRKVEISEVWQESGQDYVTALINANLLDYTVDEATGAVVSGSKTEPVKFGEYWTFTRPVGNNAWRLSAITQE